MTIALLEVAPSDAIVSSDDGRASQSYRRTIEAMVNGYATQNVDAIMSLFADDAVFCDILGEGVRGDEYHGKAAIRRAVARQFELTGSHTYSSASVMVEGQNAFASWTLIVGDPADPKAARFEGVDAFVLNDDACVTLKKAWLKGQPRLRRQLLRRNPLAMARHIGYVLRSWGR
jgi:ketosteroid isomerase-like protein